MKQTLCLICGRVHPVEYWLIELRYSKAPNADSGSLTIELEPKRDLNAGFFSSVIKRLLGIPAIIAVQFIEYGEYTALRTAIDQSASSSVGALFIGPCEWPPLGTIGTLIYRESIQSKIQQAACLYRTGTIAPGTISPPQSGSLASTNTDDSKPTIPEQIEVISPQTVPTAATAPANPTARTPGMSSPTEQKIGVKPNPETFEPPPQVPPELADFQPLNLDNQDKGLTQGGEKGEPFER